MSPYFLEHAAVLAALRRPGPFWFDGLAPLLVQYRWSRLQADYGIDQSNYGTARVFGRNPQADRNIVGYIQGPIAEANHGIVVECLRSDLTERYREMGLEFYVAGEIIESNLFLKLRRAIQIIANIKGAALAVSSVLSALHILKPGSPEYDVSYSEPALPFSIFVGICSEPEINSDLRLAESILHECMHLQLTLIEDAILLFASDSQYYLSPWRHAHRPTRGVLHAVYVFRVIQDFFTAALTAVDLNPDERRHIRRRLSEIDCEIAQVRNLSVSQDLTPIGRELAVRLQAGHKNTKARM